MEKLDLSKLKLASSSLSDRIKTGSAQMGRTISTKMKEILQTPTPESRIVDESTNSVESSSGSAEPNWGLNLRICAMINSDQLNGTEVVKAIKKKLSKNEATVQRLSLELLETLSSNCEKVCSEVASEKVLDEMVRMVDDPKTEEGNRVKVLQMIRAWGENEDLAYLPVFQQTYMNLKARGISPVPRDENSASMQRNLESYLDQHPMSPPERYPIPDTGLENYGNDLAYGVQSIEEKKEFLEITRNSLDILSSILNSEAEPKPLKEELTVSMLDKCKQSLPVLQRVIENTSDDEIMLFEALNLHDELQQVISRYNEMVASLESGSLNVADANEPPSAVKETPSAPPHDLVSPDGLKTGITGPKNETGMVSGQAEDDVKRSKE